MSSVGERLIYLMESADMKQTELAEKCGISKQSLYKYIHCKCEPRAEIIAKMAVALHTSADFIVGLTNDDTPRCQTEETENKHKKEIELIEKYRRLTAESKIRIEERMEMLLGDE